jgi:hypothetical protein
MNLESGDPQKVQGVTVVSPMSAPSPPALRRPGDAYVASPSLRMAWVHVVFKERYHPAVMVVRPTSG